MSKFAKLYEFEDIGQVLVTRDVNRDGIPELEFRLAEFCGFQPIARAPAGGDWQEDFDKIEAAFNELTRAKAREIYDAVARYLSETGEGAA